MPLLPTAGAVNADIGVSGRVGLTSCSFTRGEAVVDADVSAVGVDIGEAEAAGADASADAEDDGSGAQGSAPP